MAVEPVYAATSDWVADMGDGDGRMRDHSEAMTSALGGAALPFIMPGEGVVARATDEILFGQANVGLRFGNGEFAGRTIGEVAADLRAGIISPDQLPIQFIQREGQRITLNNRSLTALRRAKMDPTVLIDQTGIAEFEKQLMEQLRGSAPSATIRIRAGMPGMSSIE